MDIVILANDNGYRDKTRYMPINSPVRVYPRTFFLLLLRAHFFCIRYTKEAKKKETRAFRVTAVWMSGEQTSTTSTRDSLSRYVRLFLCCFSLLFSPPHLLFGLMLFTVVEKRNLNVLDRYLCVCVGICQSFLHTIHKILQQRITTSEQNMFEQRQRRGEKKRETD